MAPPLTVSADPLLQPLHIKHLTFKNRIMSTSHAFGLAVDRMPGMASPIAPFLQAAGAFEQEMNLPVFHATRITELATARYAFSEGLLDMD